jgi:cyanophycinase
MPQPESLNQKGWLLLEGGAEFGGHMSEPDLRAIELAGGFDAPIRILPTAAAPDHNHKRAGNNGIRWFQRLGARNVEICFVIDKISAQDNSLADELRSAKLIYLLGGFPHFLGDTLMNSKAWQALQDAHRNGAVVAGSSAGAMVLCEHYYDPYEKKLRPGLNLLHRCCVIPHHNNFGEGWAGRLAELLPESVLIGIDEQTGMINNTNSPNEWTVHGSGR